jgi:thiamine-phosphate pyrophosphorylase
MAQSVKDLQQRILRYAPCSMRSAEGALSIDFRLYLITDRHIAKKPLPQAVRQALEGGVRAVQLREKDLPLRELLSLAQEMRGITTEYGAKLFINDRVDVAAAVGADGVHLGGQSIPVSAVRKIVDDRMLIGASTHSWEEAWQAETEGADFLTFGPVFSTPSKAAFGAPVGIENLIEAINKVHIPIFGLGGVQSGNLYEILQTGAHGIALISGILAADDIRQAAEQMHDLIRRIAAGERPEG